MGKNFSGSNNPSWKGGLPTYRKICNECRKSFRSFQPRQRFCSRQCSARAISKLYKERFVGVGHPQWNGGKSITWNGYISLWIAPHQRMYEHRFIMEKHLNRKLTVHEDVHHINGNKQDNRLINLIVLTKSIHTRHHQLKKML